MEHQIVSRDQWIAARKELLVQEKELTRLRDRLSARRRELPWVRVEKTYVFDGPNGKETLADLFAGRSQLVVRHFMFGPEWEEGCVGCSFLSDHLEGALVHLAHHDVSVVVVSRAPLPKLQAFQRRMGWTFKWVSSHGNDFNYDYHVSFTPDSDRGWPGGPQLHPTSNVIEEMPGISVFCKDEDGRGHAYLFGVRARLGRLLGTYAILDLTPKGRDETGPGHNLTDWVRLHDRYDAADAAPCHAHG